MCVCVCVCVCVCACVCVCLHQCVPLVPVLGKYLKSKCKIRTYIVATPDTNPTQCSNGNVVPPLPSPPPPPTSQYHPGWLWIRPVLSWPLAEWSGQIIHLWRTRNMEYFRHYHRWCGIPNTCRWIAVPILTAAKHCFSWTCGGVPLCAMTCTCYITH